MSKLAAALPFILSSLLPGYTYAGDLEKPVLSCVFLLEKSDVKSGGASGGPFMRTARVLVPSDILKFDLRGPSYYELKLQTSMKDGLDGGVDKNGEPRLYPYTLATIKCFALSFGQEKIRCFDENSVTSPVTHFELMIDPKLLDAELTETSLLTGKPIASFRTRCNH